MEKIDLTYLNSITDGNKEFVTELIDIIKIQLPEFIEDLNKAYSNKDNETLSKIAHKAKSTIAIMGLQSLTDLLNKLEREAANNENEAAYEGYIKEFELSATNGLEQLEAIFN